jgi:hypothetical protein
MIQSHIGTLVQAREQSVDQRRQLVEALAKPYERGKTEEWIRKFMEVQALIEAIDRALQDERRIGKELIDKEMLRLIQESEDDRNV